MTIEENRNTMKLVVLHDQSEDDRGLWLPFVADVARVVGLETAYLPVANAGPGWLRSVLQVAAANPAPVLVLPRHRVVPDETLRPPRLRSAVIASDDSPDVARAARLSSLHLLRSGVRTRVLLVLTSATAPPMWEGAGHHAAAWREELERRYGHPDHVQVVRGAPGSAIRAHAADADLVVLLWRQAVGEDRAPVVRAVLDEGTDQPCLLLPLTWMSGAPESAGLPMGIRRVSADS